MAEEDKYRLRVTAGPEYDPETHQAVSVNSNETLVIENQHMKVHLCTRIQDYNGKKAPLENQSAIMGCK